ncbi:hypothetical protein TNCV_1975201 [Trichonephila clavipes]|nr:hypothetical protein TNCV_1975201 [Trichonephila clavipes]
MDHWRRSNLELYKIYKQPDTGKFVKLQRLKWAGHLARTNEDCCCKKIFLANPWEKCHRARARLKCIDSFEKGRSTLSRSLFPKENGSHLPRSLGQLEWRRAPCQGPFSKGRSVQGISLGQLDWHTNLPP